MAEPTFRLAAALARLDPAFYIRLQEENAVAAYLADFDSIDSLAETLPLSPFDFLEDVLEADFHGHWLRFHEAGTIRYELLNICAACEITLKEFGWHEADDSRLLRYAVITAIDDYLQEGGGDGL
ncbi:hypothetical protein G7092_01965 [Mucilaginibacter sp. HC2]|uniref:hypothetical protein n=1 Tax=Mucilaginibacter inviolabilis TaxID=2714892 RepID=UPI00140DFF23|nr:hypothetical protein [Mucilaginibacter inviolabilis]NHA02540.1 hypothetical protein [Mucilaginibacter inviolabilis]